MKMRTGFLFSLTILVLLGSTGIAAAAPADVQTGQTDTIVPYNGPIGPGNSLYGLKLAFENLDESFTFNQSERLEKQISHADLRLAELKRELMENRTDSAGIALEQYQVKINQTSDDLGPETINGTGSAPGLDETGLFHAREMIAKHQQVLEDLLQSHPNNTGLEHAYQNSIALEQKFERKLMDNGRNNGQQTMQNRPDLSSDGNGTMLQDNNAFSGNTTQNKDRNVQGINQSLQDMNRQQAGNSQGNDKQGQNQMANDATDKGSQQAGNSQNQNAGKTNNIVNPTGQGNGQNANSNGNGNVNPRTTTRR